LSPANGAETPRLLLLSASSKYPDGLANSSGLVGKNLMFNTGAVSVAVMEEPLNDYKGFAVSRVLHDFYELDANRVGFCGGGGLDARFDITPIGFAFGGLPPGSPRWGKDFKALLAQNFTRSFEIFGPWHVAARRRQQLFDRSRCAGRMGIAGAAAYL
jgi:hypothetical protein